jgi:hypothetical protein
MFRHRSGIFRESSQLSVFVGQYTEYTNVHSISNIKLLHTHSFIYHCHSLPALLNNTSKLWRPGTGCIQKQVTGISSVQFRMTSLAQALRFLRMRISHLSPRHCDSCTCAYHISRPGTATPAYQWMRNKLSLADDNIVTQ